MFVRRSTTEKGLEVRSVSGDSAGVRECRDFTPADMDYFHTALCRSRRRLVEKISALQRLVSGCEGSPLRGSLGAEVSSDACIWERLQALTDIEQKRALLREIDRALERMARKQYGLCIVDQARIPREVLEE